MLFFVYDKIIKKRARSLIDKFMSYVQWPRGFILYLLMSEEIILSFFGRCFKDFYNKWRDIPEREFAYLLQNCNLNSIDKVIVVGAGAIPYTAIFFAQQINKPVYAIEKNSLAFFACLNLLRRLKLNNIKLIKESGQHYHSYVNSLVIITLHTVSKQKILDQILNYNGYNNIILMRQPLSECDHWYETISLNNLRYSKIRHPQNFESIVLFKYTRQ
jgi:hypothetical protein